MSDLLITDSATQSDKVDVNINTDLNKEVPTDMNQLDDEGCRNRIKSIDQNQQQSKLENIIVIKGPYTREQLEKDS